jgi:RNA polymerase sigma factor (sigma-70 family)
VPDTPPSLLIRLRNRDDRGSWQQFFDQYWRLIYSFARQSGLAASDAEDVVQEVVTEVYKALPTFGYERTKGTFRAWLRTITQHKIADYLRKMVHRRTARPVSLKADPAAADPADSLAEQVWERYWRRNLVQVCLDRVREEVEPKTFQAFQLYTLDGWSAKETAEFLGLSVASVYAAKSRVAERVRHWWDKEVGQD